MIKEYFSSWRQHLNIGVAVFLSGLIHLSLIFELQLLPHQSAKKIGCQPDSSQLCVKLTLNKPPDNVSTASNTQVITALNPLISHHIDASPVSAKIMVQSNRAPLPDSDSLSSNDTNAFKNKYFATRELNMKALPITDLDTTLRNGVSHSGLPICLRVYISAYGNVIKVDKISGQDTDEEAIQRLAEMLKQTLFIAAKKEGVNVNSYQDIEFSFTAQPLQ